jgi:tetratricopeptide (TPR) repeat protein
MKIMRQYILFFSFCFIHMYVSGQDRFIRRAHDLILKNDFNEARLSIDRYVEKEPLQPIGAYSRAKWFAHPYNAEYNPDYAFSLIDSARYLMKLCRGTKLEKDDMYKEFLVLDQKYIDAFRDTLAARVFDYFERSPSIERYEYYAQKYSQYPLSTVAAERAIHLRYLAVKSNDKLYEYEEFIRKYPDAKEKSLALRRIHELEFITYSQSDNRALLEKYVLKYPTSHLVDSANAIIEKLIYFQIVTSPSILEINRFLKKYPESKYQSELKELLFITAFNEAKKGRSIDVLRQYRLTYPQSPYLDMAFNLEMEIAWERVEKAMSLQEVNRYITEYPNSPFITKAKNKQASLQFARLEESNNPDDYIAFMSEYPNSPDYEKAKKALSMLYFRKAQQYYNENDYEEAINYLTLSLNLDYTYPDSHYLLGACLRLTKNFEEAIESFNKAIQYANEPPSYYFSERGVCELSNGNEQSAHLDFQNSLGIDMNDRLANYGMGYIYENKYEYIRSLEYYRKAQASGIDVSEKISELDRRIRIQQNTDRSSNAIQRTIPEKRSFNTNPVKTEKESGRKVLSKEALEKIRNSKKKD